jgi:hypothetical protein
MHKLSPNHRQIVGAGEKKKKKIGSSAGPSQKSIISNTRLSFFLYN